LDLQLKNKIALVTGASRGLGFATARLLAAEGARLAINSRSMVNIEQSAKILAKESKAEILPLPGDVSSSPVAQQLVEAVVKQFGGLDILIANAGGPPAGSFESFNDDDWEKAFELTVMSQVRLIRAALPYLRLSSVGSVLTITSYSTKQPIPNLILSNSLRSAVIGLTKSLALELGSQGLRFNSILPAWTGTERVVELMQFRARNNNTSLEEESQKQAKESPFGRMCQPEEFANAAVFLVSPAASYITGVMLSVDGGMLKSTY
jgi:3-oxoacyl-[acyl-carrier protein] reductase